MSEAETTHPALAEALAACRRSLVAVAAFSMALNLLTLAVPLYMLQLFDRVLPSGSVDTLVALTVAVALALLAHAGLDTVRGLVMQRIGDWLERRIGGEVLAAGIRRALRRRRAPSVQGLRDLASLRAFAGGSALTTLFDAPWVVIFVGVIFLLHPVLGAITVAGAILLLALALANELGTRQLLARAGEASGEALERAEAAVRNADAIEAMGMRGSVVAAWAARNEAAISLQARAGARGQAMSSAARLVRQGMQVAVLGTAAWLAVRGELTGGAMFAAMLLMRRAAQPLERSISSWRSVVGARTAYARLKDRLGPAPRSAKRMRLPAPASGRLEVEELTYGYASTPLPVLRSVSFRLEPGEVLGLVGPTAAGKTTLCRLLVGILEPQLGHVRLDGTEVSRWDPEVLGPHVGYLPQDVELFAGSVARNIARLAEPDPEAVVEAARLAAVHDMIMRLPKGYDTEIGDGGSMLSGGQRQRIGLARALYGGPRLVVLDEPDANLDAEGRDALARAFAALRRTGATVVAITHRTDMLRHADKVMILKRSGGLGAEAANANGEAAPGEASLTNAEVALVPKRRVGRG